MRAMRVISGDLKGRRLINPEGTMVRPTGSRVKESLFSIIGDGIVDSTFVDCFSGTGNIGIEAISRGAARAFFVERNPRVVEILKRNIKNLGLGDRASVMMLDALKGVKALGKLGVSADIFFLDPPYAYNRTVEMIFSLIEHGVIAPGGALIWQHSTKTLPHPTYGDLKSDQTRVYGDTAVTFFTRA
jgi:16S rRNA (guanine(966)-N(2))-methyltransferase RsmD